jgi:hypothetical protein
MKNAEILSRHGHEVETVAHGPVSIGYGSHLIIFSLILISFSYMIFK